MPEGLSSAALVIAGTAVANAATHVQIHGGDPGVAGTSNTVSGVSRVEVEWTVDSDGDLSLTGTEAFSGASAGADATWISLWDSDTSGTYLGAYPLDGDQTFNAAGEYTLNDVNINNENESA